MTRALFRRLRREDRGISAVEFALIAPIFLLLVMGGLEIGHTMYVNAILVGQMQKAARDMSLEGASVTAQQGVVENSVRDAVHKLMKTADVEFYQESYHSYSDASLPPITYKDKDGNVVTSCTTGGTQIINHDVNDRGGAKDVVLLTATVTYPRLALGSFFAASPNVTLKTSTLLRNQPSDAQAEKKVLPCP